MEYRSVRMVGVWWCGVVGHGNGVRDPEHSDVDALQRRRASRHYHWVWMGFHGCCVHTHAHTCTHTHGCTRGHTRKRMWQCLYVAVSHAPPTRHPPSLALLARLHFVDASMPYPAGWLSARSLTKAVNACLLSRAVPKATLESKLAQKL